MVEVQGWVGRGPGVGRVGEGTGWVGGGTGWVGGGGDQECVGMGGWVHGLCR